MDPVPIMKEFDHFSCDSPERYNYSIGYLRKFICQTVVPVVIVKRSWVRSQFVDRISQTAIFHG
jgi:hypothetical protein